jgi:CheY-like chemotaxis protein
VSRRVLLVDSDVDALGALASALRARGLTVTNANGAFEAVEQAFKRRPDVVLAARALDEDSALADAFAAVPDLAETPILFLVDGVEGDLDPDEVLRGDVDHIVSRITEASPRGSKPTMPQEIRGDLQQVPLVDLLQLLAMNRRSGTLGITTPAGAGELRLSAGEVIDAVYRRLEGEKALYRLLGERDGHFAFSPGEPTSVRRIMAPTSRLLMEALRQVDEVQRRRTDLASAGEAFLVTEPASDDLDLSPLPDHEVLSVDMAFDDSAATSASGVTSVPDITAAPVQTSDAKGSRVGSMPPPPTLRAAEPAMFRLEARSSPTTSPPAPLGEPAERAAVAEKLTALLQMPHNLDELLDEISAPDLLILEVLMELTAFGKIRRVSLADLTTPFAPSEHLPVLRSLVARLARPGFAAPPHLVIAASARRLTTLSHAVRRIGDAIVPAEPSPHAAIPRPLGVIRLGDAVELALVGLPIEESFAPAWPLALHGAAAVVRIGDAGQGALAAHCEALELLLLDAEAMMGPLDVASPGQITLLIRAALETAAGV